MIDWPTLGIWFVAAVMFFVVGLVLTAITGWGNRGTLAEFVVYALAMWILATGLVRSVSQWDIVLAWIAGIGLVAPVTLLFGLPMQGAAMGIISLFDAAKKRGHEKY